MTGKTHNVIAFASLVTVAVYYPPQSINLLTLFSAVVGNIVGTLSPDLDQASNRLWDLLPGGNFFGNLVRPLFLGHRTISHSLLGGYLYYRILHWFLPYIINPNFVDTNLVLGAIMVGFISHLAADAVTEEGLPLFFPIPIKIGFPPIRSWRIKTGKWFENLVVFPGVSVYLVWFTLAHWNESILKIWGKTCGLIWC